jgi:hypothetical protein
MKNAHYYYTLVDDEDNILLTTGIEFTHTAYSKTATESIK